MLKFCKDLLADTIFVEFVLYGCDYIVDDGTVYRGLMGGTQIVFDMDDKDKEGRR